MVRKLTLAVSLALGTLSVPAHALGLGDLSTRSTLNQSFRGDISLLSIVPEELSTVRVVLADQQAFDRAGVERPFYLSLLKFEPRLSQSGKPVIRVTSEFPIREPFLNFLIEVNWPKGRLLREYTVLLDPPTTTTRRPPSVTPASRATTRQTTRPAQAPVAPAVVSTSPSEYRVRANDTVWGIARRLRPSGVSMEQMMMALFEANPQAFVNNDINRLRRGRILRVPSADEIQQLGRAQARAAYRQQHEQWLARRDAKPAPAAEAAKPASEQPVAQVPAAPPTAPAAEATNDQLRIATARPEGEGEAGAGDDDAVATTTDGLKARLLSARENAESSRQEAESLRSRVDDLQARLENMQRLLSLKDEQLAQLQANVSEEGAAPPAELPLPGTATVEGAADDIVLANQIDPDKIVEQAAAEAAIPAATDSSVEQVAPMEDADKAIDEVIADIVARAERSTADDEYRIADVAPQIDPDRIVEASVADTPVAMPSMPAAEPAPVVDADTGIDAMMDIPRQIDPDRIVLDFGQADSAEPVAVTDAAESDATEITIDMPEEAPLGEEIVIDGAAEENIAPAPQLDVSAGGAQQPDAPVVTAEPEVANEPQAPASRSIGAVLQENIGPASAIAAGGAVLLGVFGWLFARGRRKKDAEALAAAGGASVAADADIDDQIADELAAVDKPVDAEALDDLPDSTFLDDFSPSEINALQDETGEVDPVSEADVYIAYGRYQQAEELLRQAMDRDPERLALKHKLLEVHYATRNAEGYTALAREIADAGQDSVDQEAWLRAQDMGRELDPDNPMFASNASDSWTEGAVAAGAAVAGAGAAAVASDSVDGDTLALDGLDISELNAAYEEHTSTLSELDAPSEVAIALDLEDDTELAATPPEPSVPQPGDVGAFEPLEFEMPDAESSEAQQPAEEDITDSLDLDSMMLEAEAVVDRDTTDLNVDTDFSAAELQAQLDELSDLSALDSKLDDNAPAPPATATEAAAQDIAASLDEPINLDTAFDASDDSVGIDTLELEDSIPSPDDEVGTKLDLARAYVEMGDDDGARSILEEVISEGDDGQRGEAEKILSNLG